GSGIVPAGPSTRFPAPVKTSPSPQGGGEIVARRCRRIHLSPVGRGRERSERVRGRFRRVAHTPLIRRKAPNGRNVISRLDKPRGTLLKKVRRRWNGNATYGLSGFFRSGAGQIAG